MEKSARSGPATSGDVHNVAEIPNESRSQRIGDHVYDRSTIRHERIPALAAALDLTVFELPNLNMQRRMLLGIKTRAERTTT